MTSSQKSLNHSRSSSVTHTHYAKFSPTEVQLENLL